MALPKLTFFCELDAQPLKTLMTKQMVRRLKAMKASLSMGIREMRSGASGGGATLEPGGYPGHRLAIAAQRGRLLVQSTQCPSGSEALRTIQGMDERQRLCNGRGSGWISNRISTKRPT